MSDYKIGSIYRIIYNNIDINITYIGSTFSTINKRFSKHKQHYKEWLNNENGCSIFPYFKEYGIKNFSIVLIKQYECVDRKHLESKEQLYINKYKCVNLNSSFQILIKERKKQYYEKHLEEIKEYKKNYFKKYYTPHPKELKTEEYKQNKIKENNKKYRDLQDKEKLKENNAKYHQDNKEKIAQRQKLNHSKLYDCECGKKQLAWGGKARHNKSAFHLANI